MPSASTVTRATRSLPGSKLPSSSPWWPRPLSPVRTPTTRPSLDEQAHRRGLGQEHRALGLGALGEPAPDLRERDDDVAVVAHRRRRRDRQRPVAGEHVDLFLADRAVRRHVVETTVALEQPLQRAGPDHRARQQVRSRLLALLDDGERARRPAARRRRGAPRAAARSGSRTRARRARRRRRARRPRCARRPDRSVRRRTGSRRTPAAKSTGRDISRRACAAARRARARSCARRRRPRGR